MNTDQSGLWSTELHRVQWSGVGVRENNPVGKICGKVDLSLNIEKSGNNGRWQ